MSKSKYRYKNGQAVRVRENLELHKNYFMKSGPNPDYACVRINSAFRGQGRYMGQTVHISHKANGLYKIIEDGKEYYFSDEMLEPIKPFFCKSLL